jgi:hypothetical protein
VFPSGWPAWLVALACCAPLLPVALYLLLIAKLERNVARWSVRVLRPLGLMLVMSPGFSIGHGIAVLPMIVILAGGGGGAPGDRGGHLLLNGSIWLAYSFSAFLVELWVARRNARRQHNVSVYFEQRDRAAALRQLTDDGAPRDSKSAK